jgi:hypothetical protein
MSAGVRSSTRGSGRDTRTATRRPSCSSQTALAVSAGSWMVCPKVMRTAVATETSSAPGEGCVEAMRSSPSGGAVLSPPQAASRIARNRAERFIATSHIQRDDTRAVPLQAVPARAAGSRRQLGSRGTTPAPPRRTSSAGPGPSKRARNDS